MDFRILAGLEDLLFCGAFVVDSKDKVLADGSVEESRFLGDKRQGPAVGCYLNVSQILAVECDYAGDRFIKSFE